MKKISTITGAAYKKCLLSILTVLSFFCLIAAPASPGNTASIGDRVWLDANGNGIQDATETVGIAGLTVQLRNSANTVIATQTTTASGNYLFTGLAAGTYSVVFPVSISGAALTTPNVGTDNNIDSDPIQATGIKSNILLADAQSITNVDAGYSPNNMQLGNRVWYDTNDNGINEATENGIANLTVNLYKDDNNDNVADGPSIATTTTNATGYYLFSNLSAGNYIVGVIKPAGYMSSSEVDIIDPDDDIDLDDDGVSTTGNETRGLGITLNGGTEPGGSNINNTYDFGFLPDCACTGSTGNYLVNGSFENGTTGWSTSGGTLTTGTSNVACGTANGSNNWSSGTSKVWQDVNLGAGATVNFGGFAGTNTSGINCSPKISIIFLNASNGIISQSDIPVTRDLNLNNNQLAYYSLSMVAPVGTVKVRVQSSITCNTMKIDAFCLTSDNVVCTSCLLGYPDNSNLPKSAVIFNENDILRAIEPSSSSCGILASGFIKAWYNDEHAILLGIDSVVVKRANSTVYSTKYPVTPYSGTPNCTTNLLVGTTAASGAQAGNDVAAGGGRPIRPALFLTDLTVNGSSSRAGDWQQGGQVYNPTSICGSWKAGYRFVDSTKNPPLVTINPYADPAKNDWNLGGGEAPPPGTANEGYGALVKWNIADLGLIQGHTYRIQIMVHDGDQNKTGGDVGSKCTTIYVPIEVTSSLGDRVWKDDNGNGIQDAGEVGIAGVTLVLLNSTNQIVATTTTDAFGNYKFSNLTAGDYKVRITPPANYTLSPKTQGADINLDSDFDPITYTTGTVTLTTGQDRTDIDAGLKFSQQAAASVGDRVFLDNNGDGVQDAGEPGVSNVLVTLYNSSNIAVRSTYTNLNGNYLFTDVTPGTYTVGVSLPPAFVFSPNNGAVSVATNSDIIPVTGRTASFVVNAGDQITYVDAGIKTQSSANGSIGDFVWNDLNKNGMQEDGEPGIAGVIVRLVNATTNTIIATTTTDATGKYIFNDVPAGSYKVDFVTPSGYTTTTKLNSNVSASGTDSDVDPATSRTATFSLAAGQRITSVDAGYWLTTSSNGKIGDRVWLDANGNGVQDAGEPNVQGITVTLYDAANIAIKMAVTDANGKYIFTDLAAGNYTVGFSNLPAGFTFTTQGQGTAATGSDANPATGRTGTITLAAGQINLDIDAGIRSTMAGSASIGNRVWNDLNNNGLQDAGEPGLQGVTVELLDAAGAPIDSDPNTAGIQPTIIVTNALGEYLFTGLPAGDYKIRISTLPAGYNASPKAAGADRTIDSDGNTIAAGTSTTDIISVATGEERLDIDFGLFNPTASSGQIGDFVWFDSNNNGIQDAGEQGVPGVTVALMNATNTVIATTVTDANGAYRFVNVADATYTVKFSNLPAGFTFSPANQGGNDAVDSDANASTGLTGTFSIIGGNTNLTIDAGIYSTRAALGDYVWFDANSNGIQDATEKGIAGITVTIYNAANVAVTSAITDQNGRYFFTNLNPGTYTVGFGTIPAQMVFTTKDVVAAGDAADSDVDPATGRTGAYTLVAGQVNLTIDAGLKIIVPSTVGDFVWYDLNRNGLQDAGEPGVPGVIVTLYNAGNQVTGSAITDGNGYYLISNVPAGTGYYAVISNKPDPLAPFTLQNVGGVAANNNSKADATGKTTPFNVAEGQYVNNIDAGVYRLININGHVWNDANGLTDLEINKTGVQAIPNSLLVYLVDINTNLVVQTESILQDGSYSFIDVDVNHSYKIVLSASSPGPGNTAPIATLPSGWVRVGENLGAGPLSGNDGVPNGQLYLDTETSDVFDANFGIRLSTGEVIVG